jgi:hypothetical protein
MLTLSLIGKESNRLDETVAGLLGSLDDTLATYKSPTENTWTNLIRPALDDFPMVRPGFCADRVSWFWL